MEITPRSSAQRSAESLSGKRFFMRVPLIIAVLALLILVPGNAWASEAITLPEFGDFEFTVL